MSIVPIANRSFLHGNGKSSSISEKMIYATLDSLALKRATLPLQLLPVGEENVTIEGLNELKEKEKINAKITVKRPSFQRDDTSNSEIDTALIRETAREIDIDLFESNISKESYSSNNVERNSNHSLNSRNERNESLSDDYEKIESVFFTDTCRNENGDALENKKDTTVYAKNLSVKSKSTNDLAIKNCSSNVARSSKSLMESFFDGKLEKRSLSNEFSNYDRKKKYFAKNVLHLVPEYIVKRPKKRQKGKSKLDRGSFASLRNLSTDSKIGMNSNCKYRSRSLSREELKYLKISPPTNFVHVASATNPNLVSNENTIRYSLEQVVITHEQKCATLPLLVATTCENSVSENRMEHASIVAKTKEESTLQKYDAFDVANLKRQLLAELRARGIKTLESSQQVKTNEYRENVREEKTMYDDESSTALPANSSFLWSNRAKNLLFENMRSTLNENVDKIENGGQVYDDVGPLNLINQEDDYDDVGISQIDENRIDELSTTFQDSDDIYDDVMSPSNKTFANNESESRDDETKEKNEQFIINEYSSVNEDTDGSGNDKDVYDDVGLPSEERVNSLYTGSTMDSMLRASWQNVYGKESEWEDLEDSTTIGLPYLTNKYYFSTETQVPSKKKSGQKWSRMMRRQRSKISMKNSKSSSKPVVSCEFHDDTSDDSTYESLHSFQPDEFCTDSETETIDETRERWNDNVETGQNPNNRLVIPSYMEAPTRPNPPPPREISLTRTLGRRIKMLRRTWSITKGSLGRMRRRTSVDDDHSCEENKEFANDHSSLNGGKYFNFARHFKKTVNGPFSTFYLNDYTSANTDSDSAITRTLNKEPLYSNTKEIDHYSILGDQEPLYQFYAAAAARIASDFNSDGYEEVEGIIPSRSTTDLAKPGHRTLWCQTPQVLNSDLLKRLTTKEKKIQEAKFEILTSEASYLNSLRVLKTEFLDDSSIDEILTSVEKDKIFGDIPSVLQASEQFLAELETVWRQDPMLHDLPNVLLKYADRCLDIYVTYCSNQVSIDTTLRDLRTRKGLKFLETISQIEARSTCQNLSLHSFLMLPMQRITRLPLLADAILSKLPVEHNDRPHWEQVLSSLSYVVAECNEGARAAAKEIEMENLAKRLEYSAKIKPIVLKGKHLIKSGPVVQLSMKADTEYKLTFGKKFNKTSLYLLLLTDFLLVAKYKSNTHDEAYSIIDTCKRSLIALEPISEDSPFAGRNAMHLTLLENYSGHQIEYILTCESDTERQRWLEAVFPSKRGLTGETLYEVWDCPQVVALYCYSSNQPDELSLHPGDVINVFKKMSDGWYHGEKLLNGEQGWFPGNYTKEVASEHVRAKNLRQRHRFLTLNGNILQQRTKQQSIIH
ncbi:uncharacterized protein LOC413583 isoform X1 [Apis mellifera]|uniref:Uncharacterized protein LOC413583 isoform X1 n=2 Tax=Apis mellifera TaxID=7460 RepID=A0A7M7GY70_APIME|nr:uncharacterized protein LOC413583 isoform X1 [Apis mellifera]|eukprot:XP_006570477.1 uncharacterized protein LOC413583 isoform X1 [Apis mellifera]